jgi:dTDP-4-dehydrorhamnose 3,5-epimerase
MIVGSAPAVQVIAMEIPDVQLLRSPIHGDTRGWFSETYNKATFAAAGVHQEFVQDNHSMSSERGVVRGLHFQIPPFAQGKLVRVVRGSIFDVAVDLRRNYPSFGKHVSCVLSAADGKQLFVPIGFAHGFCTLEAHTEVVYKVTNFYSREHDRGVLWSDPDLGISWPVSRSEALLSEKDLVLPAFSELPGYFV